jgi:hypothetical protein
MLKIWAFLPVLGVLANPSVESLGRAGAMLATLPLQVRQVDHAVPEIVPTHYDLAVSRLQSKVDEVVDGVWTHLMDEVCSEPFLNIFLPAREALRVYFLLCCASCSCC